MIEEQDSLTPEQEERAQVLFGMMFDAIEKVDTSSWMDGEIRPFFGPFAINKEKAFIFQKEGEEWKRIMNILVDKNN